MLLCKLVVVFAVLSPIIEALEEIACGPMDMRNKPYQFIRNLSPEMLAMIPKCTVIEGDVHLLLIVTGNLTNADFDAIRFPNVREITGHLMLFQVNYLTSLEIIFPQLRVIRGENLLHNYALVLFQNEHLQQIGLHKLTEISRGGVRVIDNPELCYSDTLNWDEISKEPPVIGNNKPPNMCADRCPANKLSSLTALKPDADEDQRDGCARRIGAKGNVTACWDSKTCQKTCPQECKSKGLSCSDTAERVCCHEECIGGCTGPTNDMCYACRNVFFNGTCVPKCPAGFYKYQNRRCVTVSECHNKSTDESLLLHNGRYFKAIDINGNCDQECPIGSEDDPQDVYKCKKCPEDIGCTKTCYINDPIQSLSDAQQLKGCNILHGSLDISIHSSLSKNVYESLEGYLNDLREVTKFVRISFTPSFVSLNFLKNLRIIRGEELWNNDYALSIFENANLACLWPVTDNKSMNLVIKKGTVQFQNNPQLCYKTIVSLIDSMNIAQNATILDVSKYSNGHKAICEELKINLRVVYTDRHLIVLQWDVFNTTVIDYRMFLGYMLYHKEVDTEKVSIYENRDICFDSWHMTFQGPGARGYVAALLKPNQMYAFYVRTSMVNSPGIEGGISDLVFSTTKFAPPDPVLLRRVESLSAESIFVQWDPPEMPNGQVTHYRVSYRMRTDEMPNERDYCIEPIDYSRVAIDVLVEEHNFTNGGSGSCSKSKCCQCLADDEQQRRNHDDYLSDFLEKQPMAEKEKSVFENHIHNKVFSPALLRKDARKTDFVDPSQRQKRQSISSLVMSTHSNNNLLNEYGFENSASITRNTTDLNITLTGLKHFTLYEIRIWACQNISVPESSCGKSESIKAQRTLMIEENDKIIDGSVRIETVVDKDLAIQRRVFWAMSPDPNGIVLSYDIEYSRIGLITPVEIHCLPGNSHNASGGWLVRDLVPGNYSLRVRAVTLAQRGPFSTAVYFAVSAPNVVNVLLCVLLGVGCVVVVIVLGFVVVVRVCRRRFSKECSSYLLGFFSANPDYIGQINVYEPDEWEVQRADVDLRQEIGRGSFGTVYAGEGRQIRSLCGQVFGPCAVKTVSRQVSMCDRWHFLTEANVMKEFHTAFIVKLYGVVSDGLPALVVMELMAQGNLKDHLMSRRPDYACNQGLNPPNLREVLKMVCEIADGMAYLEAKKFCHRDLAARNCMVAADGTVKLGDFGMTRDLMVKDYYRPSGRRLMPVRWMAPESLKDATFTHKSDVWSYGVVLWEIATLASQPYPGLPTEEVFGFVVDAQRVMPMPSGCPKRLYDMMMQSWQFDPRQRPTFDTIVSQLVDDVVQVDDRFEKISYYFTQRGSDLVDDLPWNSSSTVVTPSDPNEPAPVACEPGAANLNGQAWGKSGDSSSSWTWFDRWFTCFDPRTQLQMHMKRDENELLQSSRLMTKRKEDEEKSYRDGHPAPQFLNQHESAKPKLLNGLFWRHLNVFTRRMPSIRQHLLSPTSVTSAEISTAVTEKNSPQTTSSR